MSKLESFIVLTFSYIIFEVLLIRIGFFFGIPISNITLPATLIIYCAGIAIIFALLSISVEEKINKYISLLGFVVTIIGLGVVSHLLSNTYDTSWDGQGYHQTAVIALSQGWNPVREKSISLKQELPSQIFAEGYPSALWEIEATVYALTGRINSAKVANFAAGFISLVLLYILFKKINFGTYIASIMSLLIVIQPVYIMQLLTFMQDSFGYQTLLIAMASLAILTISPKSYWATAMFIMAELLLVTTKYSHLPLALILGVIFGLIALNRLLNKIYVLNKWTYYYLAALIFVSCIFAYIPYIRNGLLHGAIFYPTNIPELMGSVKYNNIPNNLDNKDKLTLFFYGIFSKAQSKESGDPRSEGNLAELKVPFTFTIDEVTDSADLHNNRVGAGGPLFSGIVVLTFLFLLFVTFKAHDQHERYAVYVAYFSLGLITFLALLTPTPNLLRYANQVQLIPFAIVIPIYAVFRKRYVKAFTAIFILLMSFNVGFYSFAVFQRQIEETRQMNAQFDRMRRSGDTFQVRAQQFYSSYVILNEQKIPFVASEHLRCGKSETLVASSSTTQFCKK
ncbi:hypothetical protein A2415_03275 [candidate division WWE3 bacterium RIFOXYC1_FULL_39_7]|uniref:Glycosyltransferase RgtA/B/C/D-like domain-containing protein n=2 Tax=Katanobacteria TaxID=422282 RepID=A0A1F4X3X4_UNCKA|nr:MAG: hypothetical protein A2415_03275 [candidate division WWE3 bacterium RIFOXYC1_FULL_39_7]OGC76355.1 MAG: hypothetical protein A2619_00135 [candidate division WWE3 bacterium RIFOXYD1_FULL_39_9]